MTEDEWLTATDPVEMLGHLGARKSERKLRLYACAWASLGWDLLTDPRSREAVVTAERFADGLATAAELRLAHSAAEQAWNEIPQVEGNRRVRGSRSLTGTRSARRAAELARDAASPEQVVQLAVRNTWRENSARRARLADILRDLFGIPSRPIALDPGWLSWQGGTLRALAESIDQEQNYERSGILADALEDAGCDNPQILEHLRGPGHVRGCFVIDALLGRSCPG
jgi:hypothetical protein